MKWIMLFSLIVMTGSNSHSVIINDFVTETKCDLDTHIATYHYLGSIEDLDLDIEKKNLHTNLTIYVDEMGTVSRVNAKGGASKSLAFVASEQLKKVYFAQKKCYVKVRWEYKKRW